MKRERTRRKAFTLVELMIVMGIIVILTAFAMPNFKPAMQEAKIDQAAQTLQSDLYYTRELARSKGQNYRLKFTALGQGGYEIARQNGAAFDPPVRQLVLPERCVLSAGSAATQVIFGPTGNPGSTTVIFTIQAGSGSTAYVKVMANTGRIEVAWQ